MSLDLFGTPPPPKEDPAPAPKAKAKPLFEHILEKFKDRKFEAFTMDQVIASFPRRQPEQVIKAMRRLQKDGDIKAMPALGDGPIRYTKTLYKA